MSDKNIVTAIVATEVPLRNKPSLYPEPFAAMMAGREKRPLGDFFGLSNFGINLTRLQPGAMSALRHAHTRQDEFLYILEGHPTLYSNEGKTVMSPGMCVGFKAGGNNPNHLVNESYSDVLYLEIGDRSPGDSAWYPDDDLKAVEQEGAWIFTHKDGSAYET